MEKRVIFETKIPDCEEINRGWGQKKHSSPVFFNQKEKGNLMFEKCGEVVDIGKRFHYNTRQVNGWRVVCDIWHAGVTNVDEFRNGVW
ncbi:MAG: hypothetical protein ACI3VN_09320 [Candidatus Onthomonas sp.]